MAKMVVLVVLVVTVVAVLIKRRSIGLGSEGGNPSKKGGASAGATDSSRVVSRKAPKPYSSVSIKSRLGACKPALDLRDQLVLAAEAPTLPLANCDAETCECRYAYHDDRRQDDRRSPYGGGHGIMGGSTGNRRDPSDRRQS